MPDQPSQDNQPLKSPACAPCGPGRVSWRWLLAAVAVALAIFALFYSKELGGL